MIQEMRVESTNFTASIGHGTGLQISMTTRAGANQYRGTANYQYWTNKFNELNPSQKATFTDAGKALYDKGRSHNTALVLVTQNAGDLMKESVTNSISTVMAFRPVPV